MVELAIFVFTKAGLIMTKITIIGAGSVVTKDITDGVIAVGSPARVLREIDY